ncbi:uncharacterized protein I303_107368 [Kwoniella dejecticola CBS 10117]|uniref:Cyclin-like domain-containing protein n=1 Tax=Kwoniella dejecticola CBS 10117 TaxID=1296121 RepID=A0A1A5ZZI0_9TREE|nr:uncharacterized protein I303_06771 [Kwoniella dejecticola CBS 10117]OBR83212.1 hypothetical protein I303_06771 [Kwoniella dejecticola CBS 10117]
MALADNVQPEAGPSTSTSSGLTPGPSPYHESSQFRHWRYSPASIKSIREDLNAKSVEIVARNTELEKEAQISLGHSYTDPPPPTAYLTVSDELILLRFYCSQISKICRHGFGLPDIVETTAISYLKRFYLKNSVMEWHPKNIMPTCLFLACKTTNYPVLMDQFISKFSKLSPDDIIDTEFLVAQSLGFEFWVRSAEKALRGWSLDFQNQPNPPIDTIQRSLSEALKYLSQSLMTDLEFIYTPSQISLACFHLSNPTLVEEFLRHRYTNFKSKLTSTPNDAESGEGDQEDQQELPYGMTQVRLLDILRDIEGIIKTDGAIDIDMKKVKEIDKRLKNCTNPEKIPGTALYVKRKREKETSEAANTAAKTAKATAAAMDRESVFGSVLSIPSSKNSPRKPLSPRVTMNGVPVSAGVTRPGGAEVDLEDDGMGVRDENGLVIGGKGLQDVGLPLSKN